MRKCSTHLKVIKHHIKELRLASRPNVQVNLNGEPVELFVSTVVCGAMGLAPEADKLPLGMYITQTTPVGFVTGIAKNIVVNPTTVEWVMSGDITQHDMAMGVIAHEYCHKEIQRLGRIDPVEYFNHLYACEGKWFDVECEADAYAAAMGYGNGLLNALKGFAGLEGSLPYLNKRVQLLEAWLEENK